MTDCNLIEMKFSNCKRRKVEGSFTGGNVSGDGGVLLLQRADSKIGLTSSVAKGLKDERRRKSCKHSLQSLLRQRLYGICMGYEDLNDHNTLREDIALQTAVQEDEELAGASTLCRWENRANRESVWSIHRVLLDQFISSYKRVPREIVLDFDATDDAVHGQQEGRFFHGYYDKYCFLPLYVFCGERLLVAYLRQSKIDGAKHAWAILALLVKRLRKAWPNVKIIFRGDSGFCRHQMLRWCEKNNVGYIVGVAKNKRLKALSESQISNAGERFARTGLKQRLFGEIQYAANTWGRERKVIVKAEHTGKGPNPRYVVTNFIVPVETWKTASRSNSWAYSQTVPVVIPGGPISSACCCPHWLIP